MRKWIRRGSVLFLLAAVAAFVVYQRVWRPVPVAAFEVAPATLRVEVSGTGLLDAHLSAEVSTRIQGRVAEVTVDQGDSVEAGQVLCRLDDADLQRQVEIAEASIEVASAALWRTETEIGRANAVLALADREARRTEEAFANGAASTSELDSTTERAAVAAADLTRAEASRLEARTQIVAAERTLDLHRAQLAETVIASPFAGIVVRRDRDAGDVVVPGSSIVRIVAVEELWLSAWVDETAISALAPGQETRVVFRAEPTREYRGHVARVGLEVDPETREFLVDIAMDDLPARWAIGQRAEAFILTESLEGALVVPGEFLAVRDGVQGVFVMAGGRARWRESQVGARGRTTVQLLTGVAAGEHVVRGVDETASRALRDRKRVVTP